MAYSRNTRNTRNVFNAAGAAPRSGLMRFASELALTGGFVALVFLVMALASYSPQDAAWSTSGLATGSLHNLAGQPGAWVADVAYVLLGYSAWWCVAAAAFAWGAGVLAWLRGNARQRIGAAAPREEANQRRFGGRLAFWLGLALLLPASSGLEWLRLHRLDSGLPGNAGGVLGHLGGQVAVQWLGAPGATLAGLALLACALALVFHFSWGRLAERIGALVYGVLGAPRQQLAGAQDAWHGARAARERGQALRQERAALQEGLEEGMAEGLSPAYADSQFDAGHISQFSPEPVASGMADGVPTFLQSGAAAATGGNGRVEPAFAVPGAAAGGAASRGSAIPALSRLFGRERAAAPVPGAPVQMAGPIGTGGRIEPSFEFGAMPQPSVPAFMQGGAQPGAAFPSSEGRRCAGVCAEVCAQHHIRFRCQHPGAAANRALGGAIDAPWPLAAAGAREPERAPCPPGLGRQHRRRGRSRSCRRASSLFCCAAAAHASRTPGLGRQPRSGRGRR